MGEDEVVEIIRGQMKLDLQGCCQNIGFYSKNNVKLRDFFFLQDSTLSLLGGLVPRNQRSRETKQEAVAILQVEKMEYTEKVAMDMMRSDWGYIV